MQMEQTANTETPYENKYQIKYYYIQSEHNK